MPWRIEYFERDDGVQPAEVFEDALEKSSDRDHKRIAGKLLRLADELAEKGPLTGGGYVEKCHEAPGVWQLKADAGRRRGREFFAFDGDRAVLLYGATKGAREPLPAGEYGTAMEFLLEYQRTKRVSPEVKEDE